MDRKLDTAAAREQSRQRATPQRRRGGGLRAVAATLPAIAQRALRRRGFAEGGLIADWPGIVGAALAARCQPKKFRPARPGRERAGTLVLRVEPGFAVELMHMEPQIVERINGHFGYRAVTRLVLQQGPLAAPRQNRIGTPLPGSDDAPLRGRLAAIEDETLRSALARLGRALRHRAQS